MKKIFIVIRVGLRSLKRILTGHFSDFYRGKSPIRILELFINYVKENGLRATARKLKQTFLRIDRNIGGNLAFPNGLVSGVNPSDITEWARHKLRPTTIVIPSYNDLNVLIPCLESLQATTDPKIVDIIVVDDYCEEENREELRKLENEQVRVVFREENGGFAIAVNSGLKEVDEKRDVVLVNSDIVAHEGWFEALQYGAYEFGTDVGIVGPKLLYPDGRIQSAGSHRNTESPEFFDHYYRFQEANYGPANVPQYCIGVTGAVMYVKREFINYVGILDEGFAFAFEDMDWCLRGWKAGYRSLYFPSSVLTHVESATRHKNKTISEREQKSIDYFWKKWGSFLDNRNVRDKDGKIRVIYVLQTLGWSGGIRIVFEHANKLPKDKYSVEIWGLDHHDCPWELDPEVRMRTFKNYDRMTTALGNEEAIKVATWWETAFPVWLSSVIKGIPVYFIQEIETWFYPDDVVSQAAVTSCYRKEFKNMTTSQYNLEEIQSFGLKATAIPCGYDDDTYKQLKGVERDDTTILAVGRSFFQKNLAMTLEAWKSLGDDRPTLKLFGSEPELKKKDDRIEYIVTPSNEEVNTLYNECAIFIQTSRHEGFCLPLLEAMSTGAAVICTDAHGNRDFCKDGVNCIMVDQDNSEQLAAAIKKLLGDKALRTKLGKAAKKTAENYQWDVIMPKVDDFYTEVAKNAGN